MTLNCASSDLYQLSHNALSDQLFPIVQAIEHGKRFDICPQFLLILCIPVFLFVPFSPLLALHFIYQNLALRSARLEYLPSHGRWAVKVSAVFHGGVQDVRYCRS
jgi:hypothetical protein